MHDFTLSQSSIEYEVSATSVRSRNLAGVVSSCDPPHVFPWSTRLSGARCLSVFATNSGDVASRLCYRRTDILARRTTDGAVVVIENQTK